MAKTNGNTPEARARRRVKHYTDVMWHVASFIIINAFLWFLDLRQAGADWAFWVTIVWGIGLAVHVAYYFIGEAGPQNRRYRRFLAEEQDRETGRPA
jgi:cell division protein FtsW (lipid II flippase)